MTMVKQILQTWAEQINHKNVVKPLLAKVIDIGYASCDSDQPRFAAIDRSNSRRARRMPLFS